MPKSLQHFEDRPPGQQIDTIVLHSMHNPESDAPFSLESCRDCLDGVELSAHYLIGLDGTVWNLVPEEKKAWHAGESTMPNDGREGVNAFSIGIELIGSKDTDFTEEQYESLCSLCLQIINRHPIAAIVGHSDIAPSRKDDPWGLDWERVQRAIQAMCTTEIFFPTEQTESGL